MFGGFVFDLLFSCSLFDVDVLLRRIAELRSLYARRLAFVGVWLLAFSRLAFLVVPYSFTFPSPFALPHHRALSPKGNLEDTHSRRWWSTLCFVGVSFLPSFWFPFRVVPLTFDPSSFSSGFLLIWTLRPPWRPGSCQDSFTVTLHPFTFLRSPFLVVPFLLSKSFPPFLIRSKTSPSPLFVETGGRPSFHFPFGMSFSFASSPPPRCTLILFSFLLRLPFAIDLVLVLVLSPS